MLAYSKGLGLSVQTSALQFNSTRLKKVDCFTTFLGVTKDLDYFACCLKMKGPVRTAE